MRGIKLCYLMKDSGCWASKLLVPVMSDYQSILLQNYHRCMKKSHIGNAVRWNVSSPAHCRIVAISFSTSSRALSRSLAMSEAVKRLQSTATLPENKFQCTVTLNTLCGPGANLNPHDSFTSSRPERESRAAEAAQTTKALAKLTSSVAHRWRALSGEARWLHRLGCVAHLLCAWRRVWCRFLKNSVRSIYRLC